MRIGLAFRAFFRALFDARFAARLADVMAGGPAVVTDQVVAQPAPAVKQAPSTRPTRSDALTLLATLQREARFIDMIQEPLAHTAMRKWARQHVMCCAIAARSWIGSSD